jgi:hypothetical protein
MDVNSLEAYIVWFLASKQAAERGLDASLPGANFMINGVRTVREDRPWRNRWRGASPPRLHQVAGSCPARVLSRTRSICRAPWLLAFALAAPFAVAARGQSTPPPLTLKQGYHEMYNLQFSDAHQTFHDWQQSHPDDPMGPTSDAAAYLFSEFTRLGILRADLFVNDKDFKQRHARTPSPAVTKAFDSALSRSDQLAQAALEKSANDADALFAEVMNLGLRTDYQALIEKRNLASIVTMKQGGVLAERLLKIDPTCYDAYLAVGVENYILSLKPAPIRWLLRLYGAQTDQSVGIAKLRVTAQKGCLLRPYARLLLAVAALRDRHQEQARDLLQGLAREFPNNALYRQELAKLR